MGLPRIAEVGRLAADPELRFTNAGKAVCSMRIVFSKRRQNPQTQEWEDAGVLWVNATAWEQLAENIAESGLTKGSEVLVVGELSEREFDRNDGTKGKSLDLRVFQVGPDLTRATAKVSKVVRDSAGAPVQQRSNERQQPYVGRPTRVPVTTTGDDFDTAPPF